MTIERFTLKGKTKEQWLAMRRQDVTASDLGALFGLTPWKSALQLYAEKAGLAPDKGESRVMRRGRRDQVAIVGALREERPTWLIKEATDYFRDPEIRLGCTPDAFALDPERTEGTEGVVQCKSVASDVYVKGWCGGDPEAAPDVPLPYLLQTLCEAHLTGAKWACLAVWVRTAYTEDLKIIPVELDPRAVENISRAVKRFWTQIAEGKPPPADYKLDEHVIEWLHPKERGDEIEINDNETPTLVAEYVQLRELLKEMEERKTELATALKEKLGDAPAARLIDGSLISWRTMVRPEHLVKAWSGRVLRVTPAKVRKEKKEAAE